ncbi:MAG TPA: hypothetical protein VI197_15315 [Polyangiaceae bacterium]
MFLQFVQQPTPHLELERLVGQASRYFSAELQIVAQDAAGRQATLRMRSANDDCSFDLRARLADDSDRAQLHPAELANQSHGMAGLGERCTCVWEVTPAPEATRAACFQFGALLASIALGPWLPPDGSGLYGVRSARVLAEQLRSGS